MHIEEEPRQLTYWFDFSKILIFVRKQCLLMYG